MKIYKNIYTQSMSLVAMIALFAVSLTSCVTGVDDNTVLAEHNAWLATTPKIADLLVNGNTVGRDSLSNWETVPVKVGDVVNITASFGTGDGANESTYTIVRNYYGNIFGQEANQIVLPLTDSVFTYGAGFNQFSLDYTVPAQDDDGFDFDSGNIITISFYSLNDLGAASFTDIVMSYE